MSGGRERPADQPTDEICPTCSRPMVIKHGRFGKFIACSGYPECKTTKPVTLGITCPQPGCGGQLVERRTRKGKTFYACTNYPDLHVRGVDAAGGRAVPQVRGAVPDRARSRGAARSPGSASARSAATGRKWPPRSRERRRWTPAVGLVPRVPGRGARSVAAYPPQLRDATSPSSPASWPRRASAASRRRTPGRSAPTWRACTSAGCPRPPSPASWPRSAAASASWPAAACSR